MATYSTLEEIKVDTQANPSSNNLIVLRSEQRDAIDQAKERFCSKTGLYPLYITYSLYRRRLDEYIKAECIERESVSVQEEQVVWDDIVKDNIYVICNTPMAVGITRRTLFGFRDVERKANIKNEFIHKHITNISMLTLDIYLASFITDRIVYKEILKNKKSNESYISCMG